MASVVTRAAFEVSIWEVEVLFFANSAKFWVFRVELLESSSEAVSVPAADDHLATWTSAEHHLLDTLLPDKVRQDTEGVHAHACESGSSWGPKLFSGRVNLLKENLVKFDSVSKYKSDFSVFELFKVVVDLVGKVDHLLTDLNSDNHVVVIDDLGLKFSSTHADLNESHLLVILLDIDKSLLE